jgi:Smg protein
LTTVRDDQEDHGMSESWLGLLHVITGRLLGERRLRQDPTPLVEELEADGFAPADVALALAWVERFFAGLHGDAPAAGPSETFTSRGCRTRSAEELHCVSPGAFGLLLRLERAGVIDAAAREEILERALSLGGDEVDEEEIRAISREVLEAAGRDGSAANPPEPRPRGRHLH